MKKIYILLITTLLVSGCWQISQEGVKDLSNKSDTQVNERTEDAKRLSAPVSIPSEASVPNTWLTYRNEQHGFELRYPPEWVIIQPTGDESNIVNFQTKDAARLVEEKRLYPTDINSVAIRKEPIIVNEQGELIVSDAKLDMPFFNVERTPNGVDTLNGDRFYHYIQGGAKLNFATLVEHNGEYYSLVFGRALVRNDLLLPETERQVLASFRFNN